MSVGCVGRVPNLARSCTEVWYAIVWCEVWSEKDSEIGREAKNLEAEGPTPPSVSSATGTKW